MWPSVPGIIGARPQSAVLASSWGAHLDDLLHILHRLAFARGSEALEFVRTLRELTQQQLGSDLDGIGPILVYGARIVTPDAPAELYASIGALTLVHALGIGAVTWRQGRVGTGGGAATSELPADMALLFAASDLPDETQLR